MTEYWVSQGNKWCDFCKIYISNNPASIRNHELGQRHKDNVSKRLTSMRQEKAAKEKEQKEAAHALEQIEAKAKRSYQKDISAVREARDSDAIPGEEWEYDGSSGYCYNQSNGCYYDPKSGFYYTDALGRWVTREEALAASQASSGSVQKKPILKRPSSSSEGGSSSENKVTAKSKNGTAPGPVVLAALNPMRSVKAAPSSLTVNKRKRQNQKPKVVSEEEAAALKAREAARKRVEDREAPLLGLYRP
ncbi:zinc finger protein ZOP1 isoform X1 [Diospyros lotus]|uniref:zinc finger protein ZOP1 isoform X1 n=1 Tax=Diospyros lotus TaxID=55363 RepID=UPI0022506A0D|nr:zinc finger protein ZOP1 isoform X1 [Diospyros lotus]